MSLSLSSAIAAEPAYAPAGDRGRVAYYVAADAPATVPLVAIAGGPASDMRYLHVGGGFERIARERRTVFYDQRGTRNSSPAAETETIDRFVDDVEAVRAALGAAEIDLLGHSFGAYLAIAYAARYRDRVRSLILASAMAPKLSETTQLLEHVFPDRIEAWRKMRAALAPQIPAGSIELFHSMEFIDPRALAHYAREVASHIYNIGVNNLLRADMATLDFTPTLSVLDRPALIVHGRFDAVLAPSIGWAIHKSIRGSRFRVLEESGHMPFIEQPAEFAQAIVEFLAEVDAR
jgi:proline iminopeptidase